MKKQLTLGFSVLLAAIFTIVVVFSLAFNKNYDAKQSEGIGIGGDGSSCVSTGICVSDIPATVAPKPGPVKVPEKVVTGGGDCVGICIQDETTFSLPLNSGVIGEWIEDGGKLITKYSSCENIGVVDERTKSLKFVCDTNDALIHFNGNTDTYRVAENISDGVITWSLENPLPKVHTSEGSGGTLLK